MRYIKLLTFVFLAFGITNFAHSDDNWMITEAIIKNVSKVENNTYKYDIIYEIETSAEDEDFRYVPSPVEQTVVNAKLPPVDGQKVKLKYKRHDPETYQLIDKILYNKAK